MPIYAYRCTSCGHAKDVLQKVSDPLLTVCPACGAESFQKQLTAAGFQLKGSGWYVTDFRNNGSGTAAKPGGDAKPDGGSGSGGADGGAGSGGGDTPAKGGDTSAASASAGGCGASCACH